MLWLCAQVGAASRAPVTGNETPAQGAPVITSPLNATTSINQQFTYQFTATGATSLGVNNLAPGLAFNGPLAAIVGRPTTPGIFSITLQAMNAQGTDTKTLTLRVEPIPPTPTPTPAPTATPTPTPAPTPCAPMIFLSQNFDGVTAPALPTSWATSFTPGADNCPPGGICALGTNWTTSTNTPDTTPNAAFHNDPSCVVDARLDTPSITIAAPGSQVTFRNNYNTESTFDGGVLEISINGNAFTDIITAGGSFLSGGYNAVIDQGTLSPIAGRPAWSGNSGGYTTTQASLPNGAAGQSVRLRFRMASDCGVAGVGWHVDTVTVSAPGPCPSATPGPSPTPTPIPTATPTPTPPTLVITSSASATGRVNRPFTFQVVTSGATLAARLSATGLPSGLSADPVTGLISGTVTAPTTPGTPAATLLVTDGSRSATSTLQLTFTANPALPVITSANSVSITPGVPFTYQIQTDANTTSYFLAFAPSYMQFNPDTGVISGTVPGAVGHDGEIQEHPDLSSGIVTNVQLFASGNGGTGTLPLIFFLAPKGAVNIATRLAVGTGEDVMIAGFIIKGNAPKKVVIRAVGPTLTQFGVPNALADPVLELNEANAGFLFSNDNWRDNQEQANQIITTALQPGNDLESAILAYLNPGQYTAVVHGKNNGSGIGLAEVYDLGTAGLAANSNSRLANIATRGTVLGGDNVMIGGFIVFGQNTRVVVRAIGPSLTNFGIAGALADPTLALKDASGVTLISNDDWQQGQPSEIQAAELAPSDPRESAVIMTLPPGQFTAIVSGKGGATGVALVEVYALD